MSHILHITNGDGVANIIKGSQKIEGDVLPWRDTMHHGPFPDSNDIDLISETRARYFSGPDISYEDNRRGFLLRDNHLKAAEKYNEIILWFEHDLIDQLQILQILDWFANTDYKNTKLMMICIGNFPNIENFRGLGQLNTEQIEALIDKCQLVTEEQIELAKSGWEAFRTCTPNDMVRFVHGNCSALPFLKPSFMRFFEEFPWTCDGLTRSERQILKIVQGGANKPGLIFNKTMELERYFFAGNWRIFYHIASLCNFGLLNSNPYETFKYPPHINIPLDDFRKQEITLSNNAERILMGEFKAFDIIERDEWLGRIHLVKGQPIWTWDKNNNNFKLIK